MSDAVGPVEYVCLLHQFRTALYADFVGHYRAEHNGRVPCREMGCTADYATSANMLVHHRSAHTGDRYVCDICGHDYSTRNTFYVHLRNRFECFGARFRLVRGDQLLDADLAVSSSDEAPSNHRSDDGHSSATDYGVPSVHLSSPSSGDVVASVAGSVEPEISSGDTSATPVSSTSAGSLPVGYFWCTVCGDATVRYNKHAFIMHILSAHDDYPC